MLTPTTTDPAVAHTWLAGHTTSGIEGVVAKRVDQPYRSGVRGWQKLRTRLTAEAVIAGVLGPLHTPRVLLLGRPDPHPAAAGRAHPRPHPDPRATIGATSAARRTRNPWPKCSPSNRWARPGPTTVYTQVRPEVVVELVVDPAVERTPMAPSRPFVRVRSDLRPTDLVPSPRQRSAVDEGRERRASG